MNKTTDCNYCPYLNISERKQNRLKSDTIKQPHICLKFGKRVFHNANTKDHNPFLYPCAECIAEMDRKDGE